MSKIIFYPQSELVKEVIPAPQVSVTPEWFKKIPIYQKSKFAPNDRLFVSNSEANYSAKSCMPFLDSLTSGYTFNLWCDIQVRIDKQTNQTSVNWSNSLDDLSPIQGRPDPGFPIYNGFEPMVFTWRSHWGVKTPKGYSCIFTHPFNRTDLPFITTTGIMDTDSWGIWGNQPFSFQTGWEGVIPAGTPIIQFIPFKRDDWESEIDESLTKWGNYENLRSRSKFRGYYKNKHWKKKNYK